MKNSVTVKYWRYSNGWSEIPLYSSERTYLGGSEKKFHRELVGWYCWVYTEDRYAFDLWMYQNMEGEFDCVWKLNSSKPAFDVVIHNDEDATLFKLTWM